MDKKFFFLHIPKTGGQSINHFFRQSYSAESYIDHIESIDPKTMKTGSIKEKDFVSGHIPFPRISRHLDDIESRILFTFVREPFDHLISHISWVKNLSLDPARLRKHPNEVRALCSRICEIDFGDFTQVEDFLCDMDSYAISAFENNQLRYFSDPPYGQWTDSNYLERAMEVIERFSFIGIFENFENSVEQLFFKFDLSAKDMEFSTKINSKNIKIVQDIHKQMKLKELLHPLVERDLRLYEACKKLANQSTSANPPATRQ